jgi:hypothetical protein
MVQKDRNKLYIIRKVIQKDMPWVEAGSTIE